MDEEIEILKIFCASVTCCGCLFDYKSNFDMIKPTDKPRDGVLGETSGDGHENSKNEDPYEDDILQNNEIVKNKKYAWIIACWKILLLGVTIANLVMDIIFIKGLWSKAKLYAIYMSSVTAVSILSEFFIFRTIVNMKVKVANEKKSQIDFLFWCCGSALVSYWTEDVATIFLYLKVDGAWSKSISDMINLFTSMTAGCIALVITLAVPMILLSTRFENCMDCFCFICINEDSTTDCVFLLLFILSIGMIGVTVYPIVFACLLIWGGPDKDITSFIPPIVLMLPPLIFGLIFIVYGIIILLRIHNSPSEEERIKRLRGGGIPILLMDAIYKWGGGRSLHSNGIDANKMDDRDDENPQLPNEFAEAIHNIQPPTEFAEAIRTVVAST